MRRKSPETQTNRWQLKRVRKKERKPNKERIKTTKTQEQDEKREHKKKERRQKRKVELLCISPTRNMTLMASKVALNSFQRRNGS